MDLAVYLFKNKIKRKDFAKMVGCTHGALSYMCKRARTPNLLLAVKIFIACKGEVGFHEMLREDEERGLEFAKALFVKYLNKL